MFDPGNTTCSPVAQRIHACYAVACTVVDVSATVLFVIGSILFFGESTTHRRHLIVPPSGRSCSVSVPASVSCVNGIFFAAEV